MGIVSDIFRGQRSALVDQAVVPGPTFAVDDQAIPPGFFGLASYAMPTAYAPKIDRRSAMQVPAVKRTRDLICSTLGGLPIDYYGPDKQTTAWPLFEQPESSIARSVTMTRTIEDMLFEGIAWWRIVQFGWHGFPTKVKRLKPGQAVVNEDEGKVYVDGKHVDDAFLIRFDSPTDALLVAGARAIRTCLTLDAAAARYVDGTPPLDFFTPGSDVDPFEDDDEADEFLKDWETARHKRSTGYVPFDLKYNVAGWDPEKLQLAAARQHAVLEIARVGGVDPEELGVSTTSRTYQNDFDRRKNFTDMTIGQYRQAMEDRLSMPDVTPRGYFTKFNLDAFMRSDPKTRMETYVLGKGVGAILTPEIRDLEDRRALTPAELAQIDRKPEPVVAPAAPVAPAVPETPAVAASGDLGQTFDGEPAWRLDMPQDGPSFAVDYDRRTITGLLVPYGVVGFSGGQRWVFSQGTLKFADAKRVKLWVQHNKDRVVGYGLSFDDRPDGMYGTFQVEDGPEGDEALRKADPNGSATWDAFSVGLRPGGKYRQVGGINYAVEAPWMETSLTPAPSFDDARVHQVAASATTPGDSMTPEQRARLAALRAQSTRTADEEAEVIRLTALETANPQFSGGADGAQFDALGQALVQGIREGFQGMAALPGREIVGAGERLEITEASPYRFDGGRSEHSFSLDMRAAANGDSEARQRIETFTDEAFAVVTGNVAALNPTQNRPELYVPNLQFSRPLWDLVTQGTVDDVTPFTVPKFVSAAGLVGAHVQGVEPTPGSFTATNQTITPTAISGKIEINREVLDQGGSPQADQIIWGEMLNAWYEAIEAKIAATLNALALTEVNLGSAVNAALITALENIFLDLQYARGGNRYSAFAADGMLFKAMAAAADTTGRPLLPITGPTNADGSLSGSFDRINLGNQTVRAAWALGALISSNSYLFVPGSVYCWTSAPKRFDFQYQVKSVDLAIWGYSATAVTRDTDVKRIDYTALDA